MSQLSDQVVESHRARTDLLKWKIIAIAALGGSGLGLSGPRAPQADLALCCIPFVCAYIDLLCRQFALRAYVIGQYRRGRATAMRNKTNGARSPEDDYLENYERYAYEARNKGAYSLENGTVFVASMLISAILIYASITFEFDVLPHREAIKLCGILGVFLAMLIEFYYRFIRRKIRRLPIPGQRVVDL